MTLKGVEYEMPSKASVAVVSALERIYKILGEPKDASNEMGWKMIDNIMDGWASLYPQEVTTWKEELKDELSAERTIHEANKANGGYFPISYPLRLYKMLEMYLPDQKLHDMTFIKKMTTRYPILKTTNAKL